MDGFLQRCISLCFVAIENVARFFETVVGEYGFVIVFGLAMTLIIFRFIIKPITGYGVGSDTAKPQKKEKGE